MMPSTSAHSGQSNAEIFRTKKLFKDNSSYHNYMRLANRGEVVDKANFPKGHFHVGLPRRR